MRRERSESETREFRPGRAKSQAGFPRISDFCFPQASSGGKSAEPQQSGSQNILIFQLFEWWARQGSNL
jgi:hypothetical protein